MIRSRFRFVCLLAVCLAGVFVPFCVSAQEEGLRLPADTSSVRVPPIFPSAPFSVAPMSYGFSPQPVEVQSAGSRFRAPQLPVVPFHRTQAPYLRGSYATDGVLRALPRGAFYARGRQEVMPMWGRVNEAAVGYAHRFNQRLMLQAEVYATQVGLARFAGQSFGAAGNLVYRAADRLSFRAFGSVDGGMAPGLRSYHYGASLSVDMGERFGLELGVRRYYDPLSGRWETLPIVVPYYKWGKGALGFDVGGILYQLLDGLIRDSRGGGRRFDALPVGGGREGGSYTPPAGPRLPDGGVWRRVE